MYGGLYGRLYARLRYFLRQAAEDPLINIEDMRECLRDQMRIRGEASDFLFFVITVLIILYVLLEQLGNREAKMHQVT